MALPQAKLQISPQDYLAFERQSEVRHEYDNGQLYSMAGESLSHSRINVNVMREVSSSLRGKRCEALSPNMKVGVNKSGRYFYPDLSVACDQPLFYDEHRDVLLNPAVIIEVLSPSTEKRDRRDKLLHYLQIDSLTDYLLVSQDEPLIEQYTRQANGQWSFTIIRGLEACVTLASLDVQLKLADIYDRVEFSPFGENATEMPPQ